MEIYRIMDHVPMWGFVGGVFLITIGSLEIGHRLGVRRKRAAKHEREGPVSTVAGATIGLLGFMVALTLGAAASRLDSRKDAMIDGVNAIEAAYRVAGLVPEPHKSGARGLLREYVAVRVEMPSAFGSPDELRRLDERAKELQQALWSHAEALALADRNSEAYSQFASSLNEVFGVYNRRIILGAQQRIPLLVWSVLLLVTIVAMANVGFAFGLTGGRSVVADVALTFTMVMAVIFDLDQPGKGLIDLNQQAMHDLNGRLSAGG